MSEEDRKDVGGIKCVSVTDAAREAILAVHKTYEYFRQSNDYDPQHHHEATIAALKAAIIACGGDR